MKAITFLRFWFMSALIILGGCTRLERDVSRFTISLPAQKILASKSNSTQSVAGQLMAVLINTSGPGIQVPITFKADSHSYIDSGAQGLPESFTLEVPSGSSRLIQVLAVYENTQGDNAEIYYGDTTMDLSGGVVNVSIPMAKSYDGNVNSGSIAGRYFAEDGSNPTGFVESRYKPPGKPAMVIERSSMTVGWFNAFALENIPLDIVLIPQEKTIFSGASLNNFSTQNGSIANNKMMKVMVPKTIRSFGGGSQLEETEAESTLFGFFGPGVPASHKVCFTQNSYQYSTLFTNSSLVTPVQFSHYLMSADQVSLDKHNSVVACSSADLALSYGFVLPFDPTLLDKWAGSEAIAGFSGVFVLPTSGTEGSAPVRVSFLNNQLGVKFELLPEIPAAADGIGLYYRNYSFPHDYEQSDEAPCAAIANGAFGFLPDGVIPITAGTQVYQITRPAPAGFNQDSVVAFCPVSNGKPIGGGFINNYVSTGITAGDPCLESNPAPGTVCVGGSVYLGSLSPGATSGSGTNRYMTTPGGCGDIPGDKIGGGNGPTTWPIGDFTVNCSGPDSLAKTWNYGVNASFSIPGLTDFSGSSGVGFGTVNTDENYGDQNAAIIVTFTDPANGGHHAAARYCDGLVFGGYSDWYLPNRYELNLIYLNKVFIPGLFIASGGKYWSSTEAGGMSSWYQSFHDGMQSFEPKSIGNYVRCVRRY